MNTFSVILNEALTAVPKIISAKIFQHRWFLLHICWERELVTGMKRNVLKICFQTLRWMSSEIPSKQTSFFSCLEYECKFNFYKIEFVLKSLRHWPAKSLNSIFIWLLLRRTSRRLWLMGSTASWERYS